MKKLLLLTLGVLIALPSFARDFDYEYEGLTVTYTVIDEDAKTCQTKDGTLKNNTIYPGNRIVSGNLILPAYPMDGDTQYTLIDVPDYAFSGNGLTYVQIPNTVTSLGKYAFYGCSALKSVSIGNSVTSFSDTYTFYGCSSLKKAAYPSTLRFYTYPFGSATRIAYPAEGAIIENGFVYGPDKTTIYFAPLYLEGVFTIPESVSSIGSNAFKDCSDLTSVTIPESVTEIGVSAFEYCSGLTSIEIPNSVTEIGNRAFYGCSGLTSTIIGNSVTTIGESAFHNCSSLTSAVIGNSVTTIGAHAFDYCSDLTSIEIPNSVTTIGEWAFSECSGLTSVIIPKSVTSIRSTSFNHCSGLKKSAYPSNLFNTFPSGATIAYPREGAVIEDGFVYGPDKSAIYFAPLNLEGEFTIPESVTSIGSQAFYLCSGLTSIEIPNSVTTIGGSAFSDCSGLTSIIIEPSEENLQFGEEVFKNNSNLQSLTLGRNFDYDGKYTSSGPFYNSTITELSIGSSVSNIPSGGFRGCSKLTEVVIPNSVNSIGNYAFEDCNGLTSVTIGNSVTEIGEYAFYNCSGLTSVILPSSVTTVGSTAFKNCSGLKKSAYPSTISNPFLGAGSNGQNPYGLTIQYPAEGAIIEDGFVYGPDKSAIYFAPYTLEGVFIIPESVTSIGGSAFHDCSGLTSAIISSSVTEIGSNAFYNCSGLTSVKVSWEKAVNISSNTFSGATYSNATLDIPDNTIVSYLGSDWNNFKNISVEGTATKLFSDNVFEYRLIENEARDAVLIAGNYSAMTEANIPERFTDDSDAANPVRYYITAIGPNAFQKCSKLGKVTFSPRTRIAEIGAEAFSDCKGLTEISIPKSVKKIGNKAFHACSGLKKAEFTSIEDLCAIDFEDSSANPLYSAGHLYIGSEEVTEAVVPDGVEELNYTFAGGSYLTSVKLPASLKKIGICALENCKGLTSIEIPNSVTEIGTSAFSGCRGLTSIEIPNSVTVIGNSAFNLCEGLNSIEIPSSVTTLADKAFDNCIKLKSFTLLDGTDSIAIGFAAIPFSCSYPSGPNGYWYIAQVVEDFYLGRPTSKSFRNANLINLTIGNTVTEIPVSQFSGCEKLQTLMLGNSLTSIGDNAFGGCTSLAKMMLSTSLVTIGDQAFSGCTKLTEVILPPALETIGEKAFSGISGLKTIAMGHSVTEIGAEAFDGAAAENIYITTQTPPSAPNTAFSKYTGKLWLQDAGDNKVIDAYYDAFTCWDRFEGYAMVAATSLECESQTVTGEPGSKIQLSATVMPDNASLPYIFWRSTDPEVATVDCNGLVTIVDAEDGAGCSIIAETLYADGPVCEVTVNVDTAGINDIVADPVTDDTIDYSAPYEVYNLNGAYLGDDLDRLDRGIYIVRQGRVAKKIAL